MGQRLDLHAILKAITPNVYFQPPPNVKMDYPCIVYHRDYEQADHADNFPHMRTKRYQITVIDREADSEIPDKVGALSTASFDRFYTADDLNHDVYKLFF